MIEIKQNEDDNKDNDKDDNKVWKSCCFELNSHCVSYVGQLLFSFSVMSLCTVMLIKANGNCEQSSSYVNLLSFMIGKILSSIQSSSTQK